MTGVSGPNRKSRPSEHGREGGESVAPIVEPIEIEGLRDFMRNLRALDQALPKALRLAGNAAAAVVVDDARSRMPSVSGRARRSVKTRSTRTAVRIASGGKRAPYVPWLDYGGRVGPGNSVVRKWVPDGRYVYPAFTDNRQRVDDAYREALREIARQSGVEMT
jgi:hypothetical protein